MTDNRQPKPDFKVGCSGWFYWHWKGIVYPPELPTNRWFQHYCQHLNTVELNAPFYKWPTEKTVKAWATQAPNNFQYSVKVPREITHLKRFKGTKRLVKKFYKLVSILESKLACILFQFPPSFKYSKSQLEAILDQLDPSFTNVLEFRHPSWWEDEVCKKIAEFGGVFCTVSAPRLPDKIIPCDKKIYIRFHGASHWYRYDYSPQELEQWAENLAATNPSKVWAYFNNDFKGCAFRNAIQFHKLLDDRLSKRTCSTPPHPSVQ